MKPGLKLAILGVILLLLDQLTKWYIRSSMAVAESNPIINNIFHITFVQNTGGVWGLFKGNVSLMIWLSIAALGFIMYFEDSFPKTKLSQLFLVFVVIGLVGNLIDRIFLGYVTDFVDFRIWPVFNLADSLVSIGVAGLVIFTFIHDKTKK
ncbi:signal peptidase II [Candidatus Woesearchaeota archaeon]|nr:signal peptidase II [Candidatus Woesearchaeota archaeon]